MSQYKPKTLYLVRHGQTLFNHFGRMQGWSDIDLTQEGIEGAQQLGKYLKDHRIDLIVSSDSKRAIDTANLVNEVRVVAEPHITTTQLRELYFGNEEGAKGICLWEKLMLDESSLQEFMDKGMFHRMGRIHRPENLEAETLDTLQNRCESVLKMIHEREESVIMIVSHGVTLAMLLKVMGIEVNLYESLPNASVTKITYENDQYAAEYIGRTAKPTF
ncbi:histidine phosphatase family protein [Erysipelothrix sp. HDW6C]|uniref:histidine phosphatase family protein n=1 Tax=Erysipelothrix sp. HDW6C TaxID=2714930 RepID=UPI00140814C3|nr:histidine phosphatase family protein [Erysipelothrix sp. HDW6C]QIK70629.1 histidine phosphatase family protein [Erysipelothrix sp. HDW6C]